MTILQWFESNSLLVIGVLFALYILAFNKLPSIASWQSFLDSFESKGGQLMLLFVMDLIVLTVLVRFWKGFDAQLQTTIVGLLSGVNGAFLGAIGARNTSANANGGGPITDSPVPSPGSSLPPVAPRGDAGGAAPAPAAAEISRPKTGGSPPVGIIGDVGEHGHVGDLGTNTPATAR